MRENNSRLIILSCFITIWREISYNDIVARQNGTHFLKNRFNKRHFLHTPYPLSCQQTLKLAKLHTSGRRNKGSHNTEAVNE